MISLPLTSIFASLATVFYLILTARVITVRRSKQVSLGAGDSSQLETRMRQHGNFSEYAPLTFILMGLAEVQGAPNALLFCVGIAFLISRVTHAYGLGLMRRPIGLKLRTVGVLTCFAILIILVITLLSLALF
ncbi:MAG: putative membrane protein YecN with MAPEG domain [Celeribacter sp.]|jgi:uncharacterized membrane protein YecN with MAPEG domain